MTPQDGNEEGEGSAQVSSVRHGSLRRGTARPPPPHSRPVLIGVDSRGAATGAVAVDGVSHLWRKRKRTTQTIFIIIKRQAGQLQSDLECLEHAPHAQSAP